MDRSMARIDAGDIWGAAIVIDALALFAFSALAIATVGAAMNLLGAIVRMFMSEPEPSCMRDFRDAAR